MSLTKKDMKTKEILPITAITSFVIGVVFFTIYTFSDVYVDEQGVLHEKFFLIPLGYLFIFISIILFVVLGIKKIKKNKKD